MLSIDFDSVLSLILGSILPALITIGSSYFLLHKEKDIDISKERLEKFYFKAYDLTSEFLYRDLEKEKVKVTLKELFYLAKENEYLVGAPIMNKIYKCLISYNIRNKEIEIWAKHHKKVSKLYGDDEKYFSDLCLYITMNYHNLCDKIGIISEPLKYRKSKENLLWLRDCALTALGWLLLFYSCIFTGSIILQFLKDSFN